MPTTTKVPSEMGANEKRDAALHPAPAALIHDGRFLARSEWKEWWASGRAQRALRDLADALEAATTELEQMRRLHEIATERTVQYAAVIEKARRAYEDGEMEPAFVFLASADTSTVLRERDAAKWDEGFVTCDEWNGAPLDEGGSPTPQNPYRSTEGGTR